MKLNYSYLIFVVFFTVQIDAQVIQDKESDSHLSKEDFFRMCDTTVDHSKVQDVLAKQDSMQTQPSVLDLPKNEKIEKLSYGVKGGIGFWVASPFEKWIEYSYPIGFMVGVFCENHISDHFSILNELYFQNSVTSLNLNLGLNDSFQQELLTQYIHLPFLVKYQTDWLWDTYFNLGAGFSYLINSEYTNPAYDEIDRKRNVTSKVPRFNMTIELGFGERIKLDHSFMFFELRTQISLIKIIPKDFDYHSVNEWRNYAIILLISYSL